MLGIAVLLLPGCLPPSSPPSSPAGRLRVLIQDPVPGLDPRQAVHIRVASVARQVHCGLVRYDPPALMEGRVELAGGLANLWEESEDGKRFVFHLRSGWNFGDDDCFPGWKGREVEASDVVYSLKRWLSPPTPDPFWKVLRSLRGAKSFRASLQQAAGEGRKIPLDSLPLEGARAPDARTVILELQEPDPFFLLSLAGPAGWVVAREADERYQGDLSSHPGGIGPYRLAVLDPVSGIVLVANPGYPLLDSRGRRLPLNGGVRYRYGDPITALLGPRHYDLVYSRAGTYRRLEGRLGNKGLVVGTTTKLNTIFFSFNFRSGT
ncbi:MAG: ABC transporter substrate-binding protein, partial [Planctomycetota bacterium]